MITDMTISTRSEVSDKIIFFKRYSDLPIRIKVIKLSI